MTKNELRNGMLVQCKNGAWYVVFKDVKEYEDYHDFLVSISSGYFITIDSMAKDLVDEDPDSSQYSIVKVAECDYVGDVIRGIKRGESVEKYEGFHVIWERPDPEVTAVKSLIAELQGQLKAAQDKLEGMQ